MKFEPELQFTEINNSNAEFTEAFLDLGLQYLSEIDDTPPFINEKFLRSILRKTTESDRWLLFVSYKDERVGFIHAKIDTEERPGWGYILEFYIIPGKRRTGIGTSLFKEITHIFYSRGMRNVWLSASAESVPFWRH